MFIMNVTTSLSDQELVAEVTRLAQGEREATVILIAHLAELYGRRLHERAGYGSLFTYCVSVLRLSESAAYDRMKAAKVARRYPLVLDRLADGRLNLTTVRLVAPHLTAENHQERFASVAGKSKRRVQEELARRFPQPDVPSSVRKVHEHVVAAAPLVANAVGASIGSGPAFVAAVAQEPRPAMPTAAPERVKPLSPDRYRITFTGSASLCRKLDLARDMLQHALPSGDPAQIFERALDALLESLVEKKFAVTARPRASQGTKAGSRHIPAAVKRAVYVRDSGQCAYTSPEGRRCGQRGFLEFHHVQPYAVGGKATVENISLRCRQHNRHEADVFYGPAREYGGVTLASGPARPEAACVSANTFSFRNDGTDAASSAAPPGPAFYTPAPCP